MYTQLQNIRLLAFICTFKKKRRNSVIYRHEKKYIIARKLGMSAVTVGKYITACKDLGLITEHHNEQKFVKLSVCIQVLFPNDDFTQLRNVRFFKNHSYNTAKDFQQAIEFALLRHNVKKQEFNIARKSVIDELGTNCLKKGSLHKLKALAKEFHCSISQLVSVCRRISTAITGKYHLAGLIGCSPSTASARLSKWARNNSIKRTIVTQFHDMPCSHATFDVLKERGNKYIVPVKDGSGWMANLGSAITLLS